MRIGLLIFLLLPLGLKAQQNDSPDYKLEDHFHEIYEKYNSTPTSNTVWSQVYGYTQPREYTIVKTDTLWDISGVLFADPVFWPKIWSFNTDEISNPHEIEPGWKIRFFPGTMDNPPALRVVEYEGLALPAGKPYIPVADIPPSIPNYVPEIPSFEIPKIVQPDRTAIAKIPLMPLPGEILRDKPDYQGKIVELEEGYKLADEGLDVYVELNPGVNPGPYTVIQKIQKKDGGYLVRYRGEIQVLDRINDGDNIYRAKITSLLNTVQLGDYLISGSIPQVNIAPAPIAPSGPMLSILGGMHSSQDPLLAPYSFVFLDGGTQEGLNVGEVLNIYRQPRSRIGKTVQKKSYSVIGTLKIVRVQDSVATAYILSSKTEVRAGDLAGVQNSDFGFALNSPSDTLNFQ